MMPQLVMDELIGLKTTIKKSTRRELIGRHGTVVNETMKTLVIETQDKKEIKIPKDQCVFEFKTTNNKTIEINGKDIVARPEDRIKKYWRQFNAKHKRMHR